MIIPLLDGLKHLLNNTSGGLNILCDVLLRFIKKFGDVKSDEELCVATTVDLRFKLLQFDTEDERHRAVNGIVACVRGVKCRSCWRATGVVIVVCCHAVRAVNCSADYQMGQTQSGCHIGTFAVRVQSYIQVTTAGGRHIHCIVFTFVA